METNIKAWKMWEKTLELDFELRFPASENSGWSSIEMLRSREYEPEQFVYLPHPLPSSCLSAAHRVDASF